MTRGLARIPDPGEAARAEARGLLAELGAAGLHARLAGADPATAARLRCSDGQRIARAWEVWRGTGRSLAAWQEDGGAPAPGWRFEAIILDPPRTELRAAIAVRFHRMLAHGAVDEVRALLALSLDPALPAMRAHGVPEIAASLRGEITIEEAARLAILATGQYTKRQATWMRGRPLTEAPAHTIHAQFAGHTQFSESILAGIREFLRPRRLTHCNMARNRGARKERSEAWNRHRSPARRFCSGA